MADLDLTMTRGDEAVFVIDFDVAVAGATIWFTAKRSNRDELPVFQVLTGSGIVAGTGPNQVKATIPPAATEDLPGERVELVVDVQIQQGGGQPKTAAIGRLTIVPDVTT